MHRTLLHHPFSATRAPNFYFGEDAHDAVATIKKKAYLRRPVSTRTKHSSRILTTALCRGCLLAIPKHVVCSLLTACSMPTALDSTTNEIRTYSPRALCPVVSPLQWLLKISPIWYRTHIVSTSFCRPRLAFRSRLCDYSTLEHTAHYSCDSTKGGVAIHRDTRPGSRYRYDQVPSVP